MNDELKQRLLKEIESSGFPLELAVQRDLLEAQWFTTPNLHFRGADGQPHEIDIFALSKTDTESTYWPFGMVGAFLLVECKQSRAKPWVFFEQEWDPLLLAGVLTKLQMKSDVKPSRDGTLLHGGANSALASHHYNTAGPIARTYFEAFKTHRADSDIFTAVKSLWFARHFAEDWFGSSGFDVAERKRSVLIHPVIVFDGELVVARRDQDGAWDVGSADHVILRTIDCFTQTTDSPKPGNEVIVDIVARPYFTEYLSICQRDIAAFAEHLKQLYDAGYLERATSAG